MRYAVHWFRRDLRVEGNKILLDALEEYDGNVVCLFCFDSNFLSRADFSHNRFQFFLETLEKLQEQIHSLGGSLLVLDSIPQIALNLIINSLSERPKSFNFNRDYEPFSLKRDAEISALCTQLGIEVHTSRDHLIFEPGEILKDDGSAYKVYTPFYNKWIKKLREVSFRIGQEYSLDANLRFKLKWSDLFSEGGSLEDKLQFFLQNNGKFVDVEVPKSGFAQAIDRVEEFSQVIDQYGKGRDTPSINATSGISHYLKNGSITTSTVIHKLKLLEKERLSDGEKMFLREICWREFYYHILYYFPKTEVTAFKDKYQKLKWLNDAEDIDRWKSGKTGYPIVDAGMRQLNKTGFIHNRVRMIVASFLTKHLLVDWQIGANYFMEKLIDGDLAANTGGWQWASSTGCDAQPYFRIFNPWSQSKKFDPNGDYIKRYVEELADIKDKQLHEPILTLEKYPAPIIEHSYARERALTFFKSQLG